MTQLHWDEPDEVDLTVVGDQTGTVKAFFDQGEGSVLIVRPDRFVAGVARPVELAATIRRFATLLGYRGPEGDQPR